MNDKMIEGLRAMYGNNVVIVMQEQPTPTYTDADVAELLQIAKSMKIDLGFAEWGSAEHGAEMYSKFIDRYYDALRNAVAKFEAVQP